MNIKDKNIKKALILIAPIFIGVAVSQINIIIDRALASTLMEGSISALNYANKLNGFIMTLFISSISAVIYPTLSKLSSENKKDEFVSIIVKSINSVIMLVIPISVGAIVLANPIVSLLFQRGAFDVRATNMTAIALSMYSIGMASTGVRDILAKIFYSLKDTKTPMINSIIAVIINIILNIILMKYLKHAGLALATSISSIICILLMCKSLKRKISYFGQDKILKTTIKTSIASLIMGIIVHFSYKITTQILIGELIRKFGGLIVSILLGILVYIVLLILFEVEEAKAICIVIKNKYKKIIINDNL